MSEIVLDVRNISKMYWLSEGGRMARYDTFRDALMRQLRNPFKNMEGQKKPFWALKDVCFQIGRGDVVGIIGRNGAGKSTLLKILSRITEPTHGEVDVRGRTGALLEVGTGFHPELSGRDNLYLNGSILGMKRAEITRKFDAIVEFSEIEQFIDTAVKYYSSGMYMRLAFAVAAHLEPEILIVDEVLAVGDAEFQKKCLGKMGEVARDGRTVIFVSHNMSAVSRLCNRGILLNAGRVEMIGTANEVASQYLNGNGAGAVVEWIGDQCPGSSEVRLLSVRVLKSDGTAATNVSLSEPIKLVVRYKTLVNCTQFRCGFNLQAEGVVAFSTQQATEHEYVRSGEYESMVEIPSHLLAEHEYVVGVGIFTNRGGTKHRHTSVPNAVTFQVFDPGDGTTARGDFMQPLRGVVRPKLRWATSSI